MVCSCGEAGDHVVMRRRSADGVDVLLWSDGGVSGSLGYKLPGVPMRKPRTADSKRRALRAGRLLMSEVCLWVADDLPRLYASCEAVARRHGLPGDVRKAMAEDPTPSLKPRWTVIHADRDGRPTVRTWIPPRLFWPGIGVWDEVAGSRGRGRYRVMRHISGSRDAYESTGFAFRTQRDLIAWLMNNRVTEAA